MKKIAVTSIALALLLAACQSATVGPTPTGPGPRNFKYGTGDGMTMASAVEIRTRSDTEGGLLIREWIKQRYPGYIVHQQELMEQRDKAYNMITIIGPDNTPQNIYFDISSYYRRLGNEEFPKPMT